jgi:hypothetical protein
MIIKLPIYFELLEFVKPEESEEVISYLQGQFTDDLINQNGRNVKWKLNPFKDSKSKFKILTKSEVLAKVKKLGKTDESSL